MLSVEVVVVLAPFVSKFGRPIQPYTPLAEPSTLLSRAPILLKLKQHRRTQTSLGKLLIHQVPLLDWLEEKARNRFLLPSTGSHWEGDSKLL